MPVEMKAEGIAPCGFDCALCSAHQKRGNEKGYCSGCNALDGKQQKHCSACGRKNCSTRKNGAAFCYDCDKFPCRLLREMDKRYRERYGVSIIKNLNQIQKEGMAAFLEKERARWTCPQCGEIRCLHKRQCLKCGSPL